MPSLANEEGRQPVVYIDGHLERLVLPLASNRDRFFGLCSHYLEVCVEGQQQEIEHSPAFAWSVPELVARDTRLVQGLVEGRYAPLLTHTQDADKWLQQELAAAQRSAPSHALSVRHLAPVGTGQVRVGGPAEGGKPLPTSRLPAGPRQVPSRQPPAPPCVLFLLANGALSGIFPPRLMTGSRSTHMNYVDPSMRRDIFGWYSHRLGMDMPIVRYGHWGPAMLLFPTAGGDFLEAERMWLIRAVEPQLLAGKLQIFSINSINPWSWMNRQFSIPHKVHNQRLYSEYIEHEVVPHIRRCLQDDDARIGVMGASFGAFYATNAFFRRPDLFCRLLTMGGFFDLQPQFLHGYWSDEVYYNNPGSFVPNLPEGHALDLIRHHSQIQLLSSRGAWEHPHFTEEFSGKLRQRGIPHHVDIWGHDMAHDWPTWRQQLAHYLY